MAYTGENDAERIKATRKVVDEFVSQYTDMGLERVNGDDVSYDRILEAAQSMPFLAERKLVVLKNPSLNKIFTEKFDEFLSAISDSTDILITEGKLDKRTSFYKQLQKKTEFRDFKILDANGLARFVVKYAQERGGILDSSSARYLLERVGLNQQTVQNEIDKLVLFDPKITRQTIDALTDRLPQSRIFDLLDAAFSGDPSRTLELYADQKSQGVEPQQIVSMLVWQLHIFAVVKSARNISNADIAKIAKLNPFVIEKTQTVVRHISLLRLRELISGLREIDVRSKTEPIILDDALQLYLLSIK